MIKPAAALANGAWLAAGLPAWWRFQRALRHPAESQERVLRRLIRTNAESAYGRAHGFDGNWNYDQFRERVPIADYEALEPWVHRLMKGEPRVLTQEPAIRLVPTSGSTGPRKFIPFTRSLQREFNAAISPWLVDLCRQHPSVPWGPAYWSISPGFSADQQENSAVPIGFDDDSAYLGGMRQWLAEATFAVSPTLRLVHDVECCRYLTLLCLLRQPELRLISIWHPSFLSLLLDSLPRCWDELLKDLERGGCARSPSLPVAVRHGVNAPALQARAAALRQTGPADLRTLWPRLRVVSCWGDAQAALPLADLQRRLPGVYLQPKGLLATEAFASIPFRGSHPVAIRSHFYEFADARGNLFRAHELSRGETYAVIVTTSGGLWRYRLGDEVQVDGFLDQTPSLRFLGRGSKISDLCGEKLHEAFVSRAIAAACAACALAPAFAMLAPETVPGATPHYTFFAEGETPPALASRLEEELSKNPHYRHCRALGQLGVLRLCSLSPGAYETFSRVSAATHRRLGEIKPESLSTRTDWRLHFEKSHSSESNSVSRSSKSCIVP